MKAVLRWSAVLLLAAVPVFGQTATTPKPKAKTRKSATATAKAPAVTQQDVQALRQVLEQQQQQIQQLRDELQRRDAATAQMQQQIQQVQSAAAAAEQRAGAVETASTEQKTSFGQLESDVNDLKLNMTNAAQSAQEDQKRMAAAEGLLGRFRWSGDIRVRQEDFFQDYDGCATCVPRYRERIRVRLGLEGKLSEDFIAGLALATGTIFDPTSTNETLTSAFERKTFALDRGYITFQPQNHKWLQLTGGKFAATWLKTPQTFDNDLNPEGFSQKFSFDIKNKYLKNVSVTAMQLLFNEVAAPTTNGNCLASGFQFCANGANTSGVDSYAVGGQVALKLQPHSRITITPSFTVLNWRNEDTLLNQPAVVTGNTGLTVVPGTSPTFRPTVTPTSTFFAPNGVTNATIAVGTAPNGAPILAFLSRFLYGDAILDTTVDTGVAKLPFRLVLEYLNNMRAKRPSPVLGRQSHLYKAEASLGQLKNKGDFQFGYGFWRQEQDSVLAAFNESDQRAPTNILQHFINAQYQLRSNISGSYTLWVGRTLNSNLANARLAPGLRPGQVEPYLKRMQFDLVYKF